MKITVFGAGSIGSSVARHLLERDDIELVHICDARAGALQDLHLELNNPRLRSFQVDARDRSVLEPILRSSACVVGCASPEVNSALAAESLNAGCHFCDQGSAPEILRSELDLNNRAREKGVWIVPNCGLAPGLVNVLSLRGMEHFDRVESVSIRVGDIPLQPEEPFNFRVSTSVERLIRDYTEAAYIIVDGDRRAVDPLTGVEPIAFPGFDHLEAFYTSSGLETLVDELEGRVRFFDMKSIRLPGHASRMAFMLGLGFGEDRAIDVRTHLTYRDVLVRRIRKKLGGVYDDAVLMRVGLTGYQGDRKRTLVYQMIERYDKANGQSAMRRCVSIPTATVAYLLASGAAEGAGAAPPEIAIPKDVFCQAVKDAGLDLQEGWFDG